MDKHYVLYDSIKSHTITLDSKQLLDDHKDGNAVIENAGKK